MLPQKIERVELQTVCATNYASSVWDPYHQGDVNKLEMIPHRATKPAMQKKCQG